MGDDLGRIAAEYDPWRMFALHHAPGRDNRLLLHPGVYAALSDYLGHWSILIAWLHQGVLGLGAYMVQRWRIRSSVRLSKAALQSLAKVGSPN